MQKILSAAILVAVLGSSAQAGEADDWKKWVDGLKANKTMIADQIAQIEVDYPSFCADGLKGNAASFQFCVAAFKLRIVEAQKDAAKIELKLAAAELSSQRRDEAVKILPAATKEERLAWERQQDDIDGLLNKLKADRLTTGQKN